MKERTQDCTHMDHNQSLPFKIMYTNIVGLWLHRHAVDFKTSTILVYIILNDKDGLHGYSPASFLLTSQSNMAVCFEKVLVAYKLEFISVSAYAWVSKLRSAPLLGGGGGGSIFRVLREFLPNLHVHNQTKVSGPKIQE